MWKPSVLNHAHKRTCWTDLQVIPVCWAIRRVVLFRILSTSFPQCRCTALMVAGAVRGSTLRALIYTNQSDAISSVSPGPLLLPEHDILVLCSSRCSPQQSEETFANKLLHTHTHTNTSCSTEHDMTKAHEALICACATASNSVQRGNTKTFFFS